MFPEDLIESAAQAAESVDPLRFEPACQRVRVRLTPAPKNRLWLHVLLLVADAVHDHAGGRAHAVQLQPQSAVLRSRTRLRIFSPWVCAARSCFLSGLPFSLTLLTILMAHELGHYLACVYYGVDATLPFFLPAPTPFTGTLGAFIRIRSAIRSKRVLFDIGDRGSAGRASCFWSRRWAWASHSRR